MVVKVSTLDGEPLRIEIPGAVKLAFPIIVAFFGWMAIQLVDVARENVDQERRIEYIESSRFTPEDARLIMGQFVPRSEIESSVVNRLDRIENKLDEVLRR